MALVKRALLEGGGSGDPLVQLIQPGEMVKTASVMPEVQRFIEQLRPDPGCTYTLVNAMGYSEYYGANANKDYYGHNKHLNFNGLLHAPPDWGADPLNDMARGKKWYYGFPTYYGATVYAHHKNSDPNTLGFGDVVLVMPNDRMKRIELVMRVDHEKAHARGRGNILERIRLGERVDVSMGCFKAGAMVSMADGTQKPIEDIKVGDRVRTHTGGTGRVTELHRRKYRGEFFEIKPANSDPLHATVEHPFFAAQGAKDVHRVWKRDVPEFDWHYAKDLSGAVLSRPKITKTISPGHHWGWSGCAPSELRAFARLIGYYLAEGHLVFDKKGRACGIELTVNKADAVNDEITDLCAAIGTQNKPVWRQRENSDSAWALQIYDSELPLICEEYAGRFSKTKRLAEEVLYWPAELQLELLGAYGNGDGFASKDGSFSFSTASAPLASQVREILFRLGIPTSRNTLTHKAGTGFSAEDTTEHVVFVGRQWAPKLQGSCAKVIVREVKKRKNIFKDYGDLWAVPIREYASYYDEDDVYNFEVEGDNSYVVNGVAAHNCKVPFDLCSICTDWDTINAAWTTFDAARHAHPGIAILHYHKEVMPIRGLSITRADYCEHMRKYPGAILPDGQKVFVYNDFCRFFDISFVWIGADRTARVMWYMAPDMKPTLEPREQIHFSPSPRMIIRQQVTVVKEAMQKTAGDQIFFKRGEIEKEVPAVWAKKIELHSRCEPDIPTNILTQATDAFGPKTLLSTLGALGITAKPHEFHIVVTRGKPMSEKLASMAAERGQEFSTHTNRIDDEYAVSGKDVNVELGRSLAGAADARSSFAPHLAKRLLTPPSEGTALKKESRLLYSEPMMELGAQYNGYRLSMLEKSAEIFPKYAAMGFARSDLPLLLGLGPMIHLLSAYLRKKEDAGQELGTVSKFVADNPLFTSMSTIGAGLRVAMAVNKAGGILPAVKNVAGAIRALA